MRYLLVLYTLFVCACSFKGLEKEKINGVSFVASRDKVTQKDIDPVVAVHANYVAIMPFGFIRNLNAPAVLYNSNNQWYGETREGAKQYIEALHRNGIKVMLKPQIWVWRGEFTGNIKMDTEEDWQVLERTYKAFILEYAALAQETKVVVFCIGTELELFIKHRPDYWKQLIKEIRKVYQGKLTYAANWDEYTKTPFWRELDYIGIDGYFPVSTEKTPSIERLNDGWQPHKETMKRYSDSLNRKVVFTEFGYRSTDYTGAKPWEVDYSKTTVNLKGQEIATQALFDNLWNEPWFSGGFVWKWFTNYKKSGGSNDARFTPQNKPAENVIRSHYLRQKEGN